MRTALLLWSILLTASWVGCSDEPSRREGNDAASVVDGGGGHDGVKPAIDAAADAGPMPAGACVVGQEIPDGGCLCAGLQHQGGHCCSTGWSGPPCDFKPRTCAELGAPNCVEVWPKEQRDGYEYDAEHEVYLFRDLSNQDHTFLLMGDLKCNSTCTVFGFQDGNPDTDARTIFDLNGYQMVYSGADYQQLANNGFEQWSGDTPAGWSVVSGTVEQRSTAHWMPMHGDSVLYAPGAVVLESNAIHLPRARAYHGYVTVGRAAESDITLEVLDASDKVVCSETKVGFFRGQSLACRFDSSQPGDFRLRLKTQGEAYFDRTGIVPLGDYGVGIFTSWSLSESNTSQNPVVQNLTGVNIPPTGDHASPSRRNLIEVRNGRIIAGNENQDSYGVKLSGIVSLQLHHVAIIANGLKSHTFSAGGTIHDNYLEVQMPWYFARENSTEENLVLRGGAFYRNAAVGGQGVIRLSGKGTKVHHNFLRNNAQATNHYAIIHSGAEDPEIYNNIFDPIEGSGILTYVGHGYKIHHNVFHVRTATCNVEYINEDYSTNGIRMNDYGAAKNRDNWISDNEFFIEGKAYETAWSKCMPVTTGIFYSASGPNNRINGNTFHVTKTHENDAHPVLALYIGGEAYNSPADNKQIFDNTFETNDKAIWITTYYGGSADTWLEGNTFRRVENIYYTPEAPEAAIRMGRGGSDAKNVRLIDNLFEGGFTSNAIQFTAVNTSAAYDLTARWSLTIKVVDAQGAAVPGATVKATASGGGEEIEASTDAKGEAVLKLTAYTESGDMTPGGKHDRVEVTPHQLVVEHGTTNKDGGSVTMDQPQSITITL